SMIFPIHVVSAIYSSGCYLFGGFINFCFVPYFAANAELYCKIGVPFVMGTTGGDRQKLYKMVKDAKVYAVISPQMGKEVLETTLL
ncbi:hypothetical protein PJP12_29750, partial [Mycobacterium kansasii]